VCLVAAALAVLAGADAFAAAPHSPRIDTVSVLADQGWAGDPDLIWYDDFSGSDDLLTRYLDDGGDCRVVTYEALGGAGKSLCAPWEAGQVSVGSVIKCIGRCPADYRNSGVRPTEDFREVYWRWYVKHQPGWIGNPAKMSRATAFAGENWSQAMIAHVWGGYTLNLGISPASGVDANSQVVTTCYNDFPNLTWFGWQEGDYQIYDTDEAGRWVCLEARVKLNTPGLSDGLFTFYIDGQVEAHSGNLNWVYSWQDYGINAVFLGNYWNSGSPVAQERYFDDFVISTSYIGPAKSPVRPLVTKTAFRDEDAGQTQLAWQLQAASDLAGTDIVWDSGIIAAAGDTISLDGAHGAFQGSLVGQSMLEPDRLYALRARQQDSAGFWSDFSPWMTVLRTAPAIAGDANCDVCVDGLDYLAWSNNYLTGDTWQEGDFNADGTADGLDYVIWSNNYLQGCPAAPGSVPGPATLSLLALGACLPLLRRRR
jgi:hypothetical protein